VTNRKENYSNFFSPCESDKKKKNYSNFSYKDKKNSLFTSLLIQFTFFFLFAKVTNRKENYSNFFSPCESDKKKKNDSNFSYKDKKNSP